jgi:hypothetical protein
MDLLRNRVLPGRARCGKTLRRNWTEGRHCLFDCRVNPTNRQSAGVVLLVPVLHCAHTIMAFNFYNGDGEYQFKHRPLRCGDVFSILGTHKDHKYLLLGDPRVEENTNVTFINQVDKKEIFSRHFRNPPSKESGISSKRG